MATFQRTRSAFGSGMAVTACQRDVDGTGRGASMDAGTVRPNAFVRRDMGGFFDGVTCAFFFSCRIVRTRTSHRV